jgi:hypothetical protein
MGNHDAAALGRIDISWFNPSAMAAVLWTREELTPENRAWLDSLHPTLDGSEWGFGAVHASLRQPIEEYIVSAELAQANFALSKWPVCFFGHTHVAECYRCLDVPRRRYAMEHAPLTYGGMVALENEWKYLLNPGSCGQPRDNNPQARYGIFDTQGAGSRNFRAGLRLAVGRVKPFSQRDCRACWEIAWRRGDNKKMKAEI